MKPPPDPRERLLALATACAEEFGLHDVAALLRSPRLADAIAWASDEWRSVENDPPPVGEWVSVTGGFDWIDPPPAMVARRVRGRDVEPFWEDSLRTIIVAPTWWRPLRLPPPPSEPALADVECGECHGRKRVPFDGTRGHYVYPASGEMDCPACRGTGCVSPAQPERRCERCGELATVVPGYAGVVCPCPRSAAAPAESASLVDRINEHRRANERPCTACKGEGTQVVRHPEPGNPNASARVDCSVCRGLGVVYVAGVAQPARST